MIVNAERLAKVGPVDAATGFPMWYKDGAGTRLELALDPADQRTPAVGDLKPFVSTRPDAPAQLPDEAFYLLAEARMVSGGGPTPGRARVILALEAAFGGTGEVADGQQVVFGRIRYRIDDAVPGQFYTFTHPYGESDPVQADPKGRVRLTEDIGVTPLVFDGALGSHVAPFLRWTSGAAKALGEADPPNGYLGDGVTAHTVTGSPLGSNFVRITGPNIADAGGPRDPADPGNVNTIFTPLLVLQGRLATVDGVEVTRAVYARTAAGDVTVDVFAESEPGDTIEVTGAGPATTVMQEAQGNYFTRIPNGITVPAQVTVTNTSDPVPSVQEVVVTDAVTITQADYDSGTQTLTVLAFSSDAAPAPTLTVSGAGLADSPPGPLNGVVAPPATLRVRSSAGGSSSRAVTAVN